MLTYMQLSLIFININTSSSREGTKFLDNQWSRQTYLKVSLGDLLPENHLASRKYVSFPLHSLLRLGFTSWQLTANRHQPFPFPQAPTTLFLPSFFYIFFVVNFQLTFIKQACCACCRGLTSNVRILNVQIASYHHYFTAC